MHSFIKAAIAVAMLAPVPSFAAEIQVRSPVSTAGLDLSRPRDVAVLRHRAALAVEDVCGSYAGADIDRADLITACRRKAFASIAPKLDRAIAAAELRATSQVASGH